MRRRDVTDSFGAQPSAEDSGSNLRMVDVARIVDSGPFGYMTAGSSDVIDGINRTLSEWLGRDPSTIIGRQTFQDLLPPGDRIYFDTHIRPMLEMHHTVHEIAVRLVCADGRRLPVLMNALLRVGDDGDRRVEVVVIDATERRRYEQELLRERQMAEASHARLQVMYDVVSGLSGAETVEDIVKVVTERGERSVTGASCSVWLFSENLESVTRVDERDVARSPRRLEGDGPALLRLARGELLVIDDAEQAAVDYPIVCQMLLHAGHASAAVAPLLVDGVLTGVINYGIDEPHRFDESECLAVMSLASQTEQTLQRVQSIEAERRNREQLEGLFRFSTRLSGAVSVNDVLGVVAGDSVKLLGAADVRLAVRSEDGKSVRFLPSSRREEVATTLDLDSNALAPTVIRTGETVVVDSVDDLRRQYPDGSLHEEDGITRAIAVPLGDGGQVRGAWVFTFASPAPPDSDDVTLLHLFAEQATQATIRAFFHESEAAARARADVRLAISESLNAAITTDEVAEVITVHGRSAFDATHLAVYLSDHDDTDSLTLIADVGFDDGMRRDVALQRSNRAVGKVARTLAPVHLGGAALAKLGNTPLADQDWESVLLLPISISGDLSGLIVVGFHDADAVAPGIRSALAGLAAEASAAISRARRYEVERDVAATLQQSLLPATLGTLEGWVISAHYEPGSEHLVVGGDLFDVVRTSDGRMCVIVGDVVGHGLAAAAAMGQLRSAARALALVSSGPLEILRGLEAFARITPGVMWATIACVVIAPNGDGIYACAGHPYPILLDNAGASELLTGGRSALLGITEGPSQVARFHMKEGHCLVLYTDGVVEFGSLHIDDGIQRLQRTLEQARLGSELIDAGDVVDTVLDGSPARDDIVVICVTRLRSTPRGDTPSEEGD